MQTLLTVLFVILLCSPLIVHWLRVLKAADKKQPVKNFEHERWQALTSSVLKAKEYHQLQELKTVADNFLNATYSNMLKQMIRLQEQEIKLKHS